MRKYLLSFISFLCVGLLASSCDGLSFSNNDPLIYELSSDGTYYSVSGNINKRFNIESLTIPSSYEDIPITKISNNAFYDWDNLKEINIPSSITSIGYSAF